MLCYVVKLIEFMKQLIITLILRPGPRSHRHGTVERKLGNLNMKEHTRD